MARRKPDIDTRRTLLETAWQLLGERGSDDTSVNAVIERAGLSKGTFYHWFTSREALLDGVVDFMLDQSTGHVRAALPGPDSPAAERLRVFLTAARQWRFASAPALRAVMAVLHQPGNHPLLERVQTRSAAEALPILVEILDQGRSEGTITVDNSPLAAELILHFGHALFNLQARDLQSGAEEGVERAYARGRLHMGWLERSLGLNPGALGPLGPEFRQGLQAFSDAHRGQTIKEEP